MCRRLYQQVANSTGQPRKTGFSFMKYPLATTLLTFIIAGCGGGGGASEGSSPAPAPAPAVKDTFSSLVVSNDFNWETTESINRPLQLTSSITQAQGENAFLAGHHIVQVYSVQSEGQTPLLIGTVRSDQFGQFTPNLLIPSSLSSLTFRVQIQDIACEIQIEQNDIATLTEIPCPIAVAFD
ncbi:hypothetical protein [Thaumasiovibrio subtropicus]|uniref:hypothetical protein n=1 Tax=Thaumasiovibrio subtropicus TaxID=1891207 RepID=UPI000B35EBD8|nr:hypothetical protein [Thaumasiovibrio subtropicus]